MHAPGLSRLVLGSLLLPAAGCSRAADTSTSPDATAEHHGEPHGGPEHADAHGHGPNAAHDGHAHHRHHRFDDAEQWAKQFDDPSRDAWQKPEAVIDFIAPAEDAVVADLGAGTGYFAIRFARRVPSGRVLANDIEPDMVRYLGERATKEGLSNVVPVQGDAADPRLSEPVDIAFMCDVYHHIDDRVGYFRRVVASLRPGGRVVIVDFKKDAPADIPGPPPAMRVAQQVLVAELAEAGLVRLRDDRQTLPHQYIVELGVAP